MIGKLPYGGRMQEIFDRHPMTKEKAISDLRRLAQGIHDYGAVSFDDHNAERLMVAIYEVIGDE